MTLGQRQALGVVILLWLILFHIVAAFSIPILVTVLLAGLAGGLILYP